MAQPATKRPRRVRDGFDVVCSIGRVTFGEGDVSPRVAAFQLIGGHEGLGVFEFPNEDGTTCRVSVETIGTDAPDLGLPL